MFRLVLVLIAALSFQSIDYRNVFYNDYDTALNFMSKNAGMFLNYSASFQTDPEIIMPVLFPEAIRYSIVADYLETKSLELSYVYAGSPDFSIGYFQMKPSFVEDLEKEISKYPDKLIKYDSLLIPANKTIPEIRRERIDRLKKLEYQVIYANCMYDVLKIIYPSVFKKDKSFQIKFISTAYNHGFLSGQKEILDYSTKAFFPLNGKNNTRRYIYNEISLYFFQNDLPGIVSKIK
jgi:hypothetical protein